MNKQGLDEILRDLQKLMVRVENLQREAATQPEKVMFRGIWNQLAVTHWELREVKKHL